MNIWIELLFVAVRAGVLAMGTLCVQRGWISESTATSISGPAAIWITAGACLILSALVHSCWSKVRAAAFAWFALRFPQGSTSTMVLIAMKMIARRSFWLIAKELTKETKATDRVALGKAVTTVRDMIANGETK